MHQSSFQAGTKGIARRSVRRAFTLVEMLVAIAVILLATVALLPAFGRIISSANYSSAVNLVTATLGNARALAIRDGRDTGVVFLFDVQTQRFSLLVVQLHGQQGGTLTSGEAAPSEHTYCQVFRPATNTVPVELPKGTGVFGYSIHIAEGSGDGSQIDDDTWHWYAGELINEGNDDFEITPWLFPRNDARMFTENDPPEVRDIGVDPWPVIAGDSNAITEAEAQIAVRHANTFFIWFHPDGTVVSRNKSGGYSTPNAFLEWPDDPVDLDDQDQDPYDNPLQFDPDATESAVPGVPNPDRPGRNPEVVLRAAQQLAVVDLGRLAEETAIQRPWMVRSSNSRAPQPQYLISGNYIDDERCRRISRWIDGNAEIISFNRYTGNVMREVYP